MQNAEPEVIDKFRMNELEINGNIKSLTQQEVKNMFKKVFGTLAAFALIFCLAPDKSNIPARVSDACSYVCCDHDGDLWSW